MSVLDEYFGLFAEGEKDAEYRRRAQETFQKLLRAMPAKKNAVMQGERTGQGINATVNMGEVLGEPEFEDLDLKITLDLVGSHHGGFSDKPNPLIQLFVQSSDLGMDDHDVSTQTLLQKANGASWKKMVQDDWAKILKGMQTTFIHEFIHYMDWKRMGSRGSDVLHKSAMAQRSTEKDPHERRIDYYNSPVEFNAFFQEGVANIENYLRSLPGNQRFQEAEKLLGKSPNEFYQRIKVAVEKKAGSFFTPGFVKNLMLKNQDKFKKRIAQAWADVMRDETAKANEPKGIDRWKAGAARNSKVNRRQKSQEKG